MSYVGRSLRREPRHRRVHLLYGGAGCGARDFVMVRITGAMDGDLTGEAVEELSEEE